MKTLRILGLDVNWVVSVAALCAQELAIRKKLESLGVMPGEQDFQKIAGSLAKKIREEGQKCPDILLSLARAYPHIRGKLVHQGYKSPLYDAEVESIVVNTIGLVETLFQVLPSKEDTYQLAEVLLNLSDDELTSKIEELNARERKEVFLVLMERLTLLDWNQPDYREMNRRIRQIVKTIIKVKTEDMAALIDVAIQRFSAAVPDLIMEVLGEVGHIHSVVSLLQEKGYANWVVSRFISSNSFADASFNARVITKIGSALNDSQIEDIFEAIATNDQIQYSWGAREYLTSFISLHKSRVDPALFTKVQESLSTE